MTSQQQKLAGKIAVITGASRGIGYQAALGMAAQGAHIIAIARTVGGLEELDDEIKEMGGSATLVPIDLKDFDAIDRLGASIHERWGKLDILLGNAGTLGVVTPLPHLKPQVFEDLMAVNVTANFRLIRSLDPLLQLSDAGRALFVSSGAARSARAFVGPYAASKAALEALVSSYAHETGKSKIRVNTIDPGTLRTNMRAQYAPGEDPEIVTKPEAIVPTLIDLLSERNKRTGDTFEFLSNTWRSDASTMFQEN